MSSSAKLPNGIKVTVETTKLIESDITIEDPAMPTTTVRVSAKQLAHAAFPMITVDTLDVEKDRGTHRVLKQMTRTTWERIKQEVDLVFNAFEETFK